MSRRALLAAAVLGAVHLAGGAARAASDYDFGMALMTKFGFDEEAEKFFSDLQRGTNKDIRLTGTFGLGGIKKLRADRTDDPAEAARLYVEAKKLINEFLRDASSNHTDRGAANAALVEIQKRYLRQLEGLINDPNVTKDAKDKALREAKAIFTPLISPLREDKKRAFSKLKPHRPWPERPSPAAIRAYLAAEAAMARYYGMVLQQAELFPRSSAERKKVAKDAVKEMEADSAFCEEGELAGFVVRLNYELGRAHVAEGDLKKASERFDEVLALDPFGRPAAVRQFIELHQLFAFHKKAEAYFDAEKWDETIKVVDDMFGALPQALNEPQGNGALLFKAEALFRKDEPDYPGAIREASKVVEKDLELWGNNANQLLARVLAALESDEHSVAMSAEILHGVAVGEVQLAYRERDPSKQQEHFEKAIYWLQKTIAATRAEGVKLQDRLKHGPTAWFELGSVYAKMDLWYEARFSFEAVLRYFAKDVVGRLIADLPAYADSIKEIEKDIKAGKIVVKEGEDLNKYAVLFERAAKDGSLKALLTALDTRLNKSANNFMVSARRRHNESKAQFDAERLDEAIEIQIAVNPGTRNRQAFNRGLLDRKAAEGHLKAKRYEKAVEKYEAACEKFLASAKALEATREDAYHLAGMAFYQVMSEMGKPEFAKKLPNLAKRAPEFGGKALKAFDSFMAAAARRPIDQLMPAEQKKRNGRTAKIDVARPVIHMALGRFREAVAAADEFLAREKKAAEYVPTVMWTRVRALREVAIEALGTPDEAAALAKVEGAADAIQTDAKEFAKGALSLKAAIFNAAAEKLRALAEKAEETDKQALTARADKYSRLNARFTKELIDKEPEVTLAFLLSLATQFYNQKAYVGARELYVDRILKEWDPNGTGQKMVISEDAFEAAAKSARLGDFKNETALKKARERIKALKELVFGEPIEERRDRRYSGVIHPSKKMNWSKAYKEISAILAEAPRLTSGPELKKVADELVFRIQMMTVKLNLADCDMALARKLAGSKPEEAAKLFEEAAGHVKKVREYYWRDNELRFVEAEAYEHLGKLLEARNLYIDASRHSPEDSPNRYRALIAFSKATFRMAEAEKDPEKAEKLFRKAGAYPFSLINTSESEDAYRNIWPEAKEFLAKCDAGIEALGKKVVDESKLAKIEDVRGYSREVSADDEKLHVQLRIVDARIKTGEADPKKRDEALKGAFEVHLARLPDRALDAVTGQQRQGALKKAEADVARRTFLVRFLYQSPFKDFILKKDAVRLGVLAKENDPIPVSLLSEKALKAAKALGYVTKDDKLVPRGELPESDRELLRRELDAVEEEAPEGATEGEAAPAPAPEGDAAGADAAAPAEEVAP
ncbi:MAG: hypothetical protein ACYTKD_21955 [Planctomycetota bacterium]|jgi:hypothetical protein